jgi:hypothetical protein
MLVFGDFLLLLLELRLKMADFAKILLVFHLEIFDLPLHLSSKLTDTALQPQRLLV